jgi:alkanesulfonate monooxygenase SsuD/methylene tetrahydromethanopterin reductase-like flavin-dependent oxidoreductase (luciferase family)
MALAIIGGMPERFAPFAELHRRAAREAGHDPLPSLSINSHGYISETLEQALDESFPYVSAAMNRIGRERGWPPLQRADHDASAALRGANFLGSPEQVVEKILFQHEIFGHDRFLLQFTIGGIPHEGILRSIELLGREVAPVVREEVARRRRAEDEP